MQPQLNPAFGDEVRVFLDLARAAVLVGSLDAVSRARVEARIKMITAEWREATPRYDVLEAWSQELKDLVLAVGDPMVAGKLRELTWP